MLRENKEIIAFYRRAGIKIGENCYIRGVTMSPSDPIEIGSNCVLTNCTVLGHDASPALFLPELHGAGLLDRISFKKKTLIHDNCFVGMHAVVLCGVSIGPDSIVGAGSVVTCDVPAGTVYAGNPAKLIATLEEFKQKHRKAIEEHPEDYPGL